MKILLTMCCFSFIRSKMKSNCFHVLHKCFETTARGRSARCSKHKKIKFEPHGDFADQAFLQSNENLMNNKDPKTQNENDETPGILSNDESSICFGPMIMQDIISIMLNQRHR